MLLVENPGALQTIAAALRTEEVFITPRRAAIDGIDCAGQSVSVRVETVTPVVEVCQVAMFDPTTRTDHAALLVNGEISFSPDSQIVEIKDDMRGNSFAIGPNSPATITQTPRPE